MPKIVTISKERLQEIKDTLDDLFKKSIDEVIMYLDKLDFEEKYVLLRHLYPDLTVDKSYLKARPGVIDMKIYDKYLI